MVCDVVKLRGVLSGPYLSVYSNGKCSACISGLLKEQILSLPALKKFKAFLEGEKAKVRESKVEGGGEEKIFQSAGPEYSQCGGTVTAQPPHFHSCSHIFEYSKKKPQT